MERCRTRRQFAPPREAAGAVASCQARRNSVRVLRGPTELFWFEHLSSGQRAPRGSVRTEKPSRSSHGRDAAVREDISSRALVRTLCWRLQSHVGMAGKSAA
eukprot:363276-Chlamydomonas_euryale.AAC.1